jgi:hypothetical protein
LVLASAVSYDTTKALCDQLGGRMPIVASHKALEDTHAHVAEAVGHDDEGAEACSVEEDTFAFILGQESDVTNDLLNICM